MPNAEKREAAQTLARDFIAKTEVDIERAATRYRQITGITLRK
jgi:hypothetical protein